MQNAEHFPIRAMAIQDVQALLPRREGCEASSNLRGEE
jgi:hypothetical protein